MTPRNGSHRIRLTVLAGIFIGIVGCMDGASSGSSTPTAPTSQVGVTVVRYSPEELHQRNPADWVGRAHNLLLALTAEELKKPGVRLKDLCRRLHARISEPNAFKGADREFPVDWRSRLPQTLQNSAFCKRRSVFREASSTTALSIMTDFSPAAYALMSDVETAVDNSDTPTELASALSPILDDSYALDAQDEEGVQAVISVAQSSFEYWYEDNYAAIVGAYQEADEELSECMNGNMENQQVEAGGSTYQCEDEEWRLVRWENRLNRPQLRLVAYVPPGAALMSCPSSADNHRVVKIADTAGGMVGAVMGIGGGPGAILAASVAESFFASLTAGTIHAIITWFCNLLE